MTNATDINPETNKAFAINPNSGVWDDNYFDAKYGAANRAQQADSAQYDTLASTLPKATDFEAGTNANENQALGDYFGYLNSTTSPLDFYTKTTGAMGLPQLRKTQSSLQGTVYGLEDALRAVEPNVTATTGNSLVTEAQRQGMVTAKQAPIQQNLSTQSTALGRVSDAVTQGNQQALDLTNLNEQGEQKFIDAYKTKLDTAMTQGSQGLQAFINDTNNTLNITLAKIARGEKVSDTDAANAFSLLTLQKTAQSNLSNALAEDAAKGTSNSDRYISLGDGSELYDTSTGQIVANNTKAKTAAPTPNPWG